MSMYVRHVDGDLVVTERRSATEIGYEGPVITLPPAMARSYGEALEEVLGGEVEDLGMPHVWLDFTTRRRRPVLVLRWDGQTRQVVIDDQGESKVCGRGTDSLEGHSDAIAWAAALTGSLEGLSDDFIRYTAERSQWPESIAEAVRRGLEPTEIELDPAPVTENVVGDGDEGMTLVALRDMLADAKGRAQRVLDLWPETAVGSGRLEQAIALLGQCEDELAEARA